MSTSLRIRRPWSRRRASLAGLALLGGVALAACSRAPLSGPPELRVGRDECGECGMLINEDRSSSALLVEDRGRRAHVLYDDVGCMLDAERDGLGGGAILQRYAHDHATRAWVRVEHASFLFTDPKALPTPMGSGIVAFASSEDALRAQQRHGGRVLGYEELAQARKQWMEERYGKRGGG